MLNVQIDEKTVNFMLEKAINEKVEELAKQKYFMTYKELSEYLNISKPTIEERLVKNGLRYYKVGSKYLFKKSEVDAFLDDMTSCMNATNNDIKFYKSKK
ncbi:helix-turn-helix domain-containing protein [Bacillus thuringiensis]|uniref:Excisionase n=1 Tax=Bacillus thuringiensis TaxID=1428 RepID=A0A9X6KDV7_BACTU|nr:MULTISPECIES: helix-turn-helix domain-containing protein [Bacillus cereus group]MDA2615820.1 helix-turn-helix domain-containing protein [Bacillus cereus]MEB8819088.1 helix-turn-helix domain-containing protein [Bacillus cereus]MEB8973114.1 helix-turn-helix domain-containing protein [Bacillus cereus]MEB9135883.1 helix-turn-helix domain-containing protein [Bacillus cereus]MEB9513097.1 helix-turn-helix domain-containing protein [Bacillus cereus]